MKPVLEDHEQNKKEVDDDYAEKTIEKDGEKDIEINQGSHAYSEQPKILESTASDDAEERSEHIRGLPNHIRLIVRGQSKAANRRIKTTILDRLRTSTSVYYMSGKAGPGKSTLMKFFIDHSKTVAALRT